jgi:hypothetical protein
MKRKVPNRSLVFALWLLLGLSWALNLQGCDSNDDSTSQADSGIPCITDSGYCVGDVVWFCRDGIYQPWENCAAAYAATCVYEECSQYDVDVDSDGVFDTTAAYCAAIPIDTDTCSGGGADTSGDTDTSGSIDAGTSADGGL